MSGLGLGGLASGMDTDTIIKKILEFENKKIISQQMKKAQVEAKQDAWKQVRSSLSTLRSKLDGVRLSSTFAARSATLSDPAVASVTVSPNASTTTHSLSVTQLATYHVTASANFDSANATLSTGYAEPADFPITVTINGKNITVDSTDTLNSLKDKINGTTGIGVKAEIVKVPVGAAIKYRLVLTSTTQGAAGAMTITDDEANDFVKHIGLVKADNTLNELSAAQDAIFNLNGVDYTSNTNTITDILPGVTITLKKGGTGDPVVPVTTSITIDQNLDAAISAVEEWVKAYNATTDLLKEATKYDADAKKKGLLQGEELARSILINLRDMISRTVTGLPSDLNRLSQVGITSGAFGTADYGKIVLDKTKLREALAENADGVAKLFGAMTNNVALSSAGASIDAAESDLNPAVEYDASAVLNGDTSSDRFGSAGGGWESPSAVTAGNPQKLTIKFSGAKTIEQIRIYQPDNATYKAAETGLKDFTVEYYGADNQWHTIETVTNHSGPFKTITFDPVVATKVRVKVTATYGTNNPARITEIEVNERNDGTAATMYRYLEQTLFKSTTGALDTRDEALRTQVSEIGKQIDKLTEQMTKREAQLRQQFTRMEQTLAKLQSQSGYIAMLSQMATGTGQKR